MDFVQLSPRHIQTAFRKLKRIKSISCTSNDTNKSHLNLKLIEIDKPNEACNWTLYKLDYRMRYNSMLQTMTNAFAGENNRIRSLIRNVTSPTVMRWLEDRKYQDWCILLLRSHLLEHTALVCSEVSKCGFRVCCSFCFEILLPFVRRFVAPELPKHNKKVNQ